MSSSGNLGTAKEIYRCGHITLYQNSHSDEFLRLFLTSYGGGRKFSREVPSPYLVGRFTETARVTQSNSSQIPLTTIEQNLSQVLSSEESTESH